MEGTEEVAAGKDEVGGGRRVLPSQVASGVRCDFVVHTTHDVLPSADTFG